MTLPDLTMSGPIVLDDAETSAAAAAMRRAGERANATAASIQLVVDVLTSEVQS